jgi:NADH-quinone oxidoreductase subunit N
VGAANHAGTSAVLFYVAAYTFMVAGSFGVVGLVSQQGDGRTSLADYRGFSRSNPLLAATLTVFLLSQAGIPFTSGFFAKFYAIDSVVSDHADWIAVIAMLSGAVAAFLYLRIVVLMYLGESSETPATPRLTVPVGTRLALGLCLVVTIVAGVAPEVLVGPADHGTPYLVEPPAPTRPPGGSTSTSTGGATPTTLPGLSTGQSGTGSTGSAPASGSGG